MNKTIFKDKKIIIILGSIGTGKTTLAKEIKNTLKIKPKIYDDLQYLTTSKIGRNKIYNIMSELSKIRHTNRNFILIANQLPDKLLFYLDQSYIKKITAWVFTTIDYYYYFDLPITVPLKIRTKLARQFKKAVLTQKTTWLPYLIVTTENYELGKFKI